jgi:hypothetical protein
MKQLACVLKKRIFYDMDIHEKSSHSIATLNKMLNMVI